MPHFSQPQKKTVTAQDEIEARELRKMYGGNATVIVEGAEASESPQKAASSTKGSGKGKASDGRTWRVTAPDGKSFTTERDMRSIDGVEGWSVEAIAQEAANADVREMSDAQFSRLKTKALNAAKRSRKEERENRKDAWGEMTFGEFVQDTVADYNRALRGEHFKLAAEFASMIRGWCIDKGNQLSKIEAKTDDPQVKQAAGKLRIHWDGVARQLKSQLNIIKQDYVE